MGKTLKDAEALKQAIRDLLAFQNLAVIATQNVMELWMTQ